MDKMQLFLVYKDTVVFPCIICQFLHIWQCLLQSAYMLWCPLLAFSMASKYMVSVHMQKTVTWDTVIILPQFFQSALWPVCCQYLTGFPVYLCSQKLAGLVRWLIQQYCIMLHYLCFL